MAGFPDVTRSLEGTGEKRRESEISRAALRSWCSAGNRNREIGSNPPWFLNVVSCHASKCKVDTNPYLSSSHSVPSTTKYNVYNRSPLLPNLTKCACGNKPSKAYALGLHALAPRPLPVSLAQVLAMREGGAVMYR